MAYKGISCFAAMNPRFPVERVLDTYPENIKKPGTAVLDSFFGRKWKFTRRYLKQFSDRPHLIEWYLCFRNPKESIVKRAGVITRQMEKFGNEKTRVLICPILEDVCSDKEFRYWAKKIRKKTPYPIVRCSLRKGARGGYYEEKHGKTPQYIKTPRRRIYNPDGCSVDFRDGDTYFNKISVRKFKEIVSQDLYLWLIWTARLQGLADQKGWADTAPPVADRRFWISNKEVEGYRRILKNA